MGPGGKKVGGGKETGIAITFASFEVLKNANRGKKKCEGEKKGREKAGGYLVGKNWGEKKEG